MEHIKLKVPNISATMMAAKDSKDSQNESSTSNSNGTTIESQNLFDKVELCLKRDFDLRHNVISNQIECWDKSKNEEHIEYEKLNENNIYRYLKKKGYAISMANLIAILASDFVEEYNPFEEYFRKLPQYKGQDYIGSLAGYIKPKELERFEYHLKKHLVRTIACALEPKYFNKHALILVGYKQNTGKSTFCRFLCPPTLQEYYTEYFSTDKDGLIALSENFLINLDELATLDRQETNKLKTTFSKDTVKVRHPFGKKAISTPRRASFIGSTNDQEFLSDETGSVRWLCFEIGEIDFAYSKAINPDQIWMQAYYLYKSGFKYQLTKEDIEENEIANRKFQKTTPEQELIQEYFMPGSEDDNDDHWTASKFVEELQTRITHASISKMNHTRIGKALKSLGFNRTSIRPENQQPRYGYFVKIIKVK